MITWQPSRPPACDDHGPLADTQMAALDAAIVMLEHLQAVHGKNVTKALGQLADRRQRGEDSLP